MNGKISKLLRKQRAKEMMTLKDEHPDFEMPDKIKVDKFTKRKYKSLNSKERGIFTSVLRTVFANEGVTP